MIRAYARLLARRRIAWSVLAATLVVAVCSGFFAARVQQDDDLFAFLPSGDPDVRRFREIDARFGGTDIAMVGIAAEDVFEPGFLAALASASRELQATPGVERVLSLTSVEDAVPDPVLGGVITGPLVARIPSDASQREALRAKVMSRDAVVGNLVSSRGDAVVIYCFPARGSEPRALASAVRSVVEAHFPEHPTFWAGSPFLSSYVYETSQRDMRRLLPWALGAMVTIAMLALRDALATALILTGPALGILVAYGVMGALGVPSNLVMSAMPVVLFAVGSAYGVHVLTAYQASAGDDWDAAALRRSLEESTPPLLTAGLTASAAMLSMLAMDIEPMRRFGLFTAVGLGAALFLSLSFVPATIVVARRAGRRPGRRLLPAGTSRAVGFVQSQRAAVGVVLLALAVAAASQAARVQARMDLGAFFAAGSPPDRAQRFLEEHFGGSEFLQVHVAGDLGEPEVLREVQRVSDRISLIPAVSSVSSVSAALALSAEVMAGARRVPDTAPQVGVLLGFLSSDPSVSQLLSRDHDQALLQIRIGSRERAVLEATRAQVEALIADVAIHRYEVERRGGPRALETEARIRELMEARIRALARSFEVPLGEPELQGLRTALAAADVRVAPEPVRDALARFLLSTECFVELAGPEAHALAGEIVAAGPAVGEAAVRDAAQRVLGSEDERIEDLVLVVPGPLRDLWRAEAGRQEAQRLVAALALPGLDTPRGVRFVDAVGAALMDRENPSAMLPSDDPQAQTLEWAVSGSPVLYDALSRSVQRNQTRSLALAVGVVLVILVLRLRSPRSGLLAISPILLTLVLVYGAMGAAGLPLDLGTSMLGIVVIGAGVDYTVHFLAAWRAPEDAPLSEAGRRAAGATAGAVWTSALLVAAGFGVLALARSRPLQGLGLLTAAAMLAAAASTFLVIPLLARRRRYGRRDPA